MRQQATPQRLVKIDAELLKPTGGNPEAMAAKLKLQAVRDAIVKAKNDKAKNN